MADRNNPFDVLREDDATEPDHSPGKSMSSAGEILAHWRRKSSSRNHQTSMTSHPINDNRMYNRGVKPEAKICKAHFTAWRRNLHRGCEDNGCTLHHDPRDWPDWCVELVPSGPMKELLEIQRDIDVVLGKGAFDVDAELARIKPSVSSPRRARNQQHGIRNTTTEIEELSPEELAIKGQRIQQIWDESLRQYRLRKQMPEEAQATGGFSSIQYHPAHNMQRPVSFFDDDDPEDQDSDQ